MTWLRRYRLWEYFRTSLWIIPAFGMVVALGTIRILRMIEAAMGWTVKRTLAVLLDYVAGAPFKFNGKNGELWL